MQGQSKAIAVVAGAFLALSVIPANARKAAAADGPYALLRSVRTPMELIGPRFPSAYQVPVTIGGDIAAEIDRTMTDMGLDKPQLEETMDRKGIFRLAFSNKSYTAETRELLSGFLNPIEIIELTINSLLKYRDNDKFGELKHDTQITVGSEQRKGRTVFRVNLVPRGNRFAYEYHDYGTFMEERWLTSMSAVIDSSLGLVYAIEQERVTRATTAVQSAAPSTKKSAVCYEMVYSDSLSGFLPQQLSMKFNGKQVLTINAAYRRQGQYTVFDTRSICYTKPEQELGCLTMQFGEYSFKKRVPVSAKAKGPATDRSKDLERAAELSRSASEKMRAGDISGAGRLFKRLSNDFADTPQGVEARRLMESLPEGF